MCGLERPGIGFRILCTHGLNTRRDPLSWNHISHNSRHTHFPFFLLLSLRLTWTHLKYILHIMCIQSYPTPNGLSYAPTLLYVHKDAMSCAVVDTHDIIANEKTCRSVKEFANILSIGHQKRACLNAGYSEEHCISDMSCCLTY